MQTFIYLAIVSYLIGSAPLEAVINHGFGRTSSAGGGRSFIETVAPTVMAIFKGVLAVYVARVWVGGHMSQVLATLFLTIGYVWPLLGTFRPQPAMLAVFGALVLLDPRAFLFLGITGLAAYLASRSLQAASIVAGVATPLFMYYAGRPDNSVVMGIAVAGLVVYQSLGYLEKIWGLEARLSDQPSQWNRAQRARRWRMILRRASVLALILVFCTLFIFNRYVYRGFGHGVHLFRQGPEDFDLLVLTFDDGPDPRYTPAILDILSDYGVTATFFMVGEKVEQHPELARRVAEEGHEIGNHTYSHRNMYRLGRAQKEQEIDLAHDAIYRATGVEPHLFRPPRGMYDAQLLELLEERRYTMVLYSLSSQDWAEIHHGEMARLVLSRTRPGDILLFHDSGDLIGHERGTRINTVRALPLIIEGLQEKGYAFVSTLEMMIITGLTAEP